MDNGEIKPTYGIQVKGIVNAEETMKLTPLNDKNKVIILYKSEFIEIETNK